MREFVFTTPKIDGEASLRYNALGFLIGFDLRGNWTQEQIHFMVTNIPLSLETLLKTFMPARGKEAELREVKQDLSFDAFWNAYNYKVGNRKRTQKLWEALSDTDRMICMVCIPQYDRFLLFKKNMEKAYAETFLHQRRFEHQYKYK